MRIDKLAVTAQEALQNAISIAADEQAAAVEPEHLLKACLLYTSKTKTRSKHHA